MSGLLDDECVRVWCSRRGVDGWEDTFRFFVRFYEEVLGRHPLFRGMSPSQLVEWQANARGRDAYLIKGLAQEFINGLPLRFKTKQKRLTDVSSFFLNNHAPLPPDPSFHFTSDTPPVEGCLTKEAFVAILHNCNKMYRAVFLMLAQSLQGVKEFTFINVNHWRLVLTHLTKNDGVFRIPLPGRKRNRNKKTFFAMLSTKSDWATAMREYVKSSPHPIHGALFRNDRGKPLTKENIQHYFHRRAVEAGVVKQFSPPCSKCGYETAHTRKRQNGTRKIAYVCKECGNIDWASGVNHNFPGVRYGVNVHEIRDLTRSRWRQSGAKTVVAEFVMEHGNIDPNEYDKMKYTPGYAEEEYRKALAWLNVLSEDPQKVDRSTVDAKLETYQAQNQLLSREIAHLTQYVKTLESQLKERAETNKLEEEILDLLMDPRVKKQLEKLRDNI